MQKTRRYFLLFLIVFIASILRFYELGSNPPSLTWDEAAWGYNAYAIATTARDEFGRFLPLDYFESFGDFKPPVYAYLTVFPVMLFGLSEFATRFPSAFFGVLAVIITYFFVKRIFYNAPHKEWYALSSSAFLAVSPWHINLSRAAFEANVATTLLLAGVWLFFCGIQKKPIFLLFSSASFALSMHTFNTSRIIAPCLMVILVLFFLPDLKKHFLYTLMALAIGILLLSPAVPFLFSAQARLRYEEVNIFSDIEVVKRANQQSTNVDNAVWAKFLANRRVFYAREYAKHYFDNLNPQFLFIKGDGNPKFSTQRVGQLYLWDLLFLLAGILLLFRKKEGYWFLIPLWSILAIIPAATARETPHALRIATMLPLPQVLIAYGFVNMLLILRKINIKKNVLHALTSVLMLALIINVTYYLHDYYTHYPRAYSREWQYGYKDAIEYIKATEKSYDKIYITESLGRPYIYVLFHTQYDPALFRQKAKIEREVYGFVHVTRFGKYYFSKNIHELPKKPGEKILYINDPQNVPVEGAIKNISLLLDGRPSLVAYTL